MGRKYVWRFKCPYCGERYAKKTFWVKHIAKHINPAKKVSND